ncbi:hypothetical protein CSQ93_07630 [Janthinobacterium sp. BJB426]|uniref:DUF2625 family protein n=1 Tax=Janthinobacterium sp. BJB426 TaxID=2048010 RepID=UPI000C1181AD|nr:DUF2625 family protein [Janthinobacterium sp. BJB426]PHV29019.1 hypothetical protein CSQ93_07630 [Janthinobacterium sp. BJB426]
MRTLNELLDSEDPAFALIKQWASEADIPVELLPPSAGRAEVLLSLQITTRSPLGAIAYETGGILVDDGWLRILGSGHGKLERNIATWNEGKAEGFLLVADDVLGGFFALNGGALGPDQGQLYYLAPETLEWEALEIGYTAFVEWAFTSQLRQFYGRQPGEAHGFDELPLSGDLCLNFYPFLWTQEGALKTSSRRAIPVEEQWALNLDLKQKVLDAPGSTS